MLAPAGLAIVALGIIGIIWGVFQKIKAGRVADAPFVKTGEAASRGREVASPRGAISVEGAVHCAEPVIAPMSGEACLWYHLTSKVSWKDGDTDRSKDLDDQKVAAAFSVDDGSGAVFVEASEGGDFEPTRSRKESKKVGLLAGIKGTDLQFGRYTITTGIGSMEETYEVEETYLPLQPRLYVCGKATDRNVIASPDWRQLLISNKTREEILGSAQRTAKVSLLGGGLAFAVGSVMALIAQLTAPPAAAAERPTSAATAPADTTEAPAKAPEKKAPATVRSKVTAPKK
jgi:hypothetical protein